MSRRYKGAIISATPPTTTGGYSGTAPGEWTLQSQMQAQGGGTWPAQPIWYVEDVFSTYLYTGNGSTQTITNNINLSTYGGLVWAKNRSGAGQSHELIDTVRGATKYLSSNATSAQTTDATSLTAFTSSGFSIGSDAQINGNTVTFASWTFRKQVKFFDIVTYTGNGSNRTISHNLGSVPGCIIVKKTSAVQEWVVYHRATSATPQTNYLILNTTGALGSANYWNSTAPTDSVFSVSGQGSVNENGATYVAYIFAHNAGGFGLTGTDNVISCGSYTGDGTTTKVVSLGYEPQYVLLKRTSSTSD